MIRGPYGPTTGTDEAQQTIKKLVLPCKRDIYRRNEDYGRLSDEEKVQLDAIIESLRQSKMLKVCKDKWHLKRRLAFSEELRKTIQTEIGEKQLIVHLKVDDPKPIL